LAFITSTARRTAASSPGDLHEPALGVATSGQLGEPRGDDDDTTCARLRGVHENLLDAGGRHRHDHEVHRLADGDQGWIGPHAVDLRGLGVHGMNPSSEGALEEVGQDGSPDAARLPRGAHHRDGSWLEDVAHALGDAIDPLLERLLYLKPAVREDLERSRRRARNMLRGT
jgi:hypothetical protein